MCGALCARTVPPPGRECAPSKMYRVPQDWKVYANHTDGTLDVLFHKPHDTLECSAYCHGDSGCTVVSSLNNACHLELTESPKTFWCPPGSARLLNNRGSLCQKH